MSIENPYEKLGLFEALVHERRSEQAFICAIEFLTLLQSRYFHREIDIVGYGGSPYPTNSGLCERFSAAWGVLLLDPGLDISKAPLFRLLRNLHVIHELAHGSASGNLDHYLAVLQARAAGRYTPESLARVLLLWVPGSRVPIDWRQFYPHLPKVVVAVAVATVGGMVMSTRESHRARESAIEFLVSGTPQVEDYEKTGLGSDGFHSAWMFCSYATSPKKHKIKRFLNEALSRQSPPEGSAEFPARAASDKPVMIVPLEQFQSAHSMYRCYGPVLAECRKRFFMVAISMDENVDQESRELFDVFHDINKECRRGGKTDMALVAQLVTSYSPSMVFYPSIGMQHHTIDLCNRRLAPVQAMTYGHPATSESKYIDYGLTEGQWIVDPRHFSEHMIALPRGTLRYALHADFSGLSPKIKRSDDVLRVAVPSFAQKWTWPFLEALSKVRERVGSRVEFHFFSGLVGYSFPAAMNAVLRALPSAVVYPAMKYGAYIDALARCDVHAATFPFGGTNSVFDSLSNGLPVVCLSAREIHGAQEEDFLQRVGLPSWLVARNEDEYVNNLVRLVEEPSLLSELQSLLADRQAIADVFARGGSPEIFADALLGLARRDAAQESR